MFDKRTTSSVAQDPSGSRMILPTVYSCMLSGSDADSTARQQQTTIPVYFRAPRRSASRSQCFIHGVIYYCPLN